MITVSAPGKLMLFGEHAVVYGYPCIVTAVDKRLYVEAEIIQGNEDEIITPQVKESRFVLETLAYVKKKFHINSCVRIKTRGDFSHQVGLGSSSAVTVATFEALNKLFTLNLSKKDLFEMSYHVTLLIQGVGSGFDVAVATMGGTLYYVKGGKQMQSLSLSSLPLVVGYSGIKADTPFYIRKVAEAFRKRRKEMIQYFESIATIVTKAQKYLMNNDFEHTGKLLTENHYVLQELGVSTPILDDMVKASIEAGAWGAKLSGAGGGDCMIALVDQKKRGQVKNAILETGGEVIEVEVNTTGVTEKGEVCTK